VSRDGSNVYTLPVAPVAGNETITATKWNDNFNDLATAMSDSLCRSTETTATTRALLLESSASNVAQALGVWHVIASSSISSSTSGFTFAVPSDAEKIRVEFWNVRPVTNNTEFCFLASINSGVSYLTTSIYFPYGTQYDAATTTVSGVYGSARGNFALSVAVPNTAGSFATGSCDIEVSGNYGVTMQSSVNLASVSQRSLAGGGVYFPGARPTNIGLYMSSGNIATGEIRALALR
jgi:hypothetical protein